MVDNNGIHIDIEFPLFLFFSQSNAKQFLASVDRDAPTSASAISLRLCLRDATCFSLRSLSVPLVPPLPLNFSSLLSLSLPLPSRN